MSRQGPQYAGKLSSAYLHHKKVLVKVFYRLPGLVIAGIVAILGASMALSGCGDDHSENAIILNDNDGRDYNPSINAADFVKTIDNPFLTLTPGQSLTFEGTEDGETVRSQLEVTHDTKVILGVTVTVVRDRSFENGQLTEDTLDWYAQDRVGNVWYFGEDSKAIKNDKVVSTEGSWEAGKDGAKPGIVMKAQPRIGDTYRQEYLKGEAEGMAEVLATDKPTSTRLGQYQRCLQIKEWAPDEASIVEHKFYCAEVGNLVLAQKVKGESGQVELVEIKAAR